ncbi:carnitine O-acetyltransferase-like [Amphiura filiformis]|uniref:carnitine O-acetyltransferase-like n=1 Tax=Amphiura filiformis TaxID=82378 RepID=UPI003B2210FA
MSRSFYKIMPRFRAPALHQTLHRYLLSVEPLITPHQHHVTKGIVLEFGKPGGIGERLQQGLSHRMHTDDKWFHNMWLDNYFLKDRRSHILRNVAAVCPRQHFRGAVDQIRFAAKLTAGVLDFKSQLDTRTLSQDMMHGQPLCMMQYQALFHSCRVPDVKKDSLFFEHESLTASRHIIVVSNNQFYAVDVLDKNGTPLDVNIIYDRLVYVNHATRIRDIPVAILTTENRNTWSEVYQKMAKSPVNRQTFDDINKAIFILCLDKTEGVNEKSEMDDALYGLTGGGSAGNSGNRWFDKSIQMYVSIDGKVGAVYDHSVSDGSVRARLLDHALNYAKDLHRPLIPKALLSEDCRPRKLSFHIDNESLSAITKASEKIDVICELQFAILKFHTFGKLFLKSQSVSPDGFIQMAIQLTNYKLFRRPVATSESALLRMYRYGRTETIRSLSNASNAFVYAMDSAPDTDRTCQLLVDAIDSHKQYTNWAITGNGVDRHLLALKLMALERSDNLPEFFQDIAYTKSSHFTVLSSQVNLQLAIGTCFAPEYRDGNSLCYNVQDNNIFFTVGSFTSSLFSAEEFAETLEESLYVMRHLLYSRRQ